MVQSPSWEANWFAASQEIPRISRNPKVHYHTHKRPPPLSILSQPNPVRIPTSHLLEIRPNIIHSSTPRSPQWSLSPWFPHQDPIHPLSSPIRTTCPVLAHIAFQYFTCGFMKLKVTLQITLRLCKWNIINGRYYNHLQSRHILKNPSSKFIKRNIWPKLQVLLHNFFLSFSLKHLVIWEWVPVTTTCRVRLRMEDWPPTWRVAADILNMQSPRADKRLSSSLGFGRFSNNSSP